MTEADYGLVANVSLLFAELPLSSRFAAAAEAGFHSTELWWPFAGPVPSDSELTSFFTAIQVSGIPLSGMNLWAGDMAGGERGVLSQSSRRSDFEANLEIVAEIARATGCRVFNALYGQRVSNETPQSQDDTAIDNLFAAAEILAATGGTVLVEPLSQGLNGDYPIVTIADAMEVILRARKASGRDTIALLFDTFHLANNGEDLVGAIHAAGDLIGHVQLADAPGRGEPGSGSIDFVSVLNTLVDVGYAKSIACEYVPTRETTQTLSWIEAMPYIRLAR